MVQGWILAAQGQGEEGIKRMHQGLAEERATGSVMFRAVHLALLAEVYGQMGQAEEGLSVLAEALAAANKRISNILKKADHFIPGEPQTELFQQTEEIALNDKISEMTEHVTPMLLNADYENTLKALAALREPVDTFFDEVMVMTDDEKIKSNRLSLLTRLQHLFLQVADISHLVI